MTTVFLSQFWVQRLGWTLLHFLWQGTVIAVVYAVLRNLLGRSLSPRGRYVLACAALCTMAVASPLTFLLIPDARGTGRWTISASESQSLLRAVVALWLLGVLILSIRLVGGWRFTARLRSTSHPAPAEWQQTLERIAARMGTSRRVRLLVSSMVDVPTVMGWLRPVILVPVAFLTGLSFDHINALLAHELAHVRRHDYLASILQNIIETALFYHPAVWWISEQIRAERELCCDDLAVAATGNVLAYARALADLESRQPARLMPVLAANGGLLVNRVPEIDRAGERHRQQPPGTGDGMGHDASLAGRPWRGRRPQRADAGSVCCRSDSRIGGEPADCARRPSAKCLVWRSRPSRREHPVARPHPHQDGVPQPRNPACRRHGTHRPAKPAVERLEQAPGEIRAPDQSKDPGNPALLAQEPRTIVFPMPAGEAALHCEKGPSLASPDQPPRAPTVRAAAESWSRWM